MNLVIQTKLGKVLSLQVRLSSNAEQLAKKFCFKNQLDDKNVSHLCTQIHLAQERLAARRRNSNSNNSNEHINFQNKTNENNLHSKSCVQDRTNQEEGECDTILHTQEAEFQQPYLAQAITLNQVAQYQNNKRRQRVQSQHVVRLGEYKIPATQREVIKDTQKSQRVNAVDQQQQQRCAYQSIGSIIQQQRAQSGAQRSLSPNSQELCEVRAIRRYREIFNFLDGAQAGSLSAKNLALQKLDVQLLSVISPFLLTLLADKREIEEREFCRRLRTYATSSALQYSERDTLLNANLSCQTTERARSQSNSQGSQRNLHGSQKNLHGGHKNQPSVCKNEVENQRQRRSSLYAQKNYREQDKENDRGCDQQSNLFQSETVPLKNHETVNLSKGAINKNRSQIKNHISIKNTQNVAQKAKEMHLRN